MSLSGLDLWVFHLVNGLCGKSAIVDRIIGGLDATSLKSMAIFATFGALWHVPSQDLRRQREVLLTLFFAVAAALVLNRGISLMLPFRIRPMYTADIGYIAPAATHHADLEHWSSFPSDNATLLLAVTACFWLVSRGWGVVFGLFSLAVLAARVYMGVHYPADVVVGALLGLGVAVAFNRDAVREAIAGPLLIVEKRAPTFFYALLFAALFEMGSMFWLTRKLGKGLYHMLAG